MPIRPIDVRRKEFKNSFRGYDANQVDDFLDAVADEFERTYTDNSRMREEISSLRERLQQFEELEGSIRAALVHAEEAANDLRRSATQESEDLRLSANREADFTIREAKARSHQMLAESSARVERIQESYEALQEAKRDFANDFRHLLKTYMDMMENMEVVSAREIEASLRERLDTESIAVAREAAIYEGTGATPEYEGVEQEPGAVPGEDSTAGFEEERAAEDQAATQRIEPVDTAGEVPQTEPEVEEPEVEPSTIQEESPTVSHEPEVQPVVEDETVVEEPSTPEESAVLEEPESVQEPAAAEEPVVAEEPVAVEEPAASEDVEREESSLAEERSSESFFDREEGGTSSGEDERESRIFRASRFLRRRE
jgi:cell division initiation protein